MTTVKLHGNNVRDIILIIVHVISVDAQNKVQKDAENVKQS